MAAFIGKRVYITGGSSGIGLATASRLVSLGADVLLLARSPETLEAAGEFLMRSRQSPAQRIQTLFMDVENHQQVLERTDEALETFGGPDILILSAGINTTADHFENISHDAFTREINVNVMGVRSPIHALLAPMKEKRGHVVILSSAAALFGMFGYTTYAASKAALFGLAESLRYELHPLGMTVSIVFPPEVDTPMNEKEAKTLPREARAVKSMSGCLTPEFTAREIVNGIRAKKFMIIPGRRTRFLYLIHRLSSGRMTRWVSDRVIRQTRKKGSL